MIRVTAAGSVPGDDFRGALVAMSEALPELLPWPEVPGRGVGSDMIGRALGLIDGLGFDLQPAGWRLTTGASADHRRAAAAWRRDLDDAEELLQGFDGLLKLALAGPWTLAATVERPRGDRVLADHGMRRDLAQALTEAWHGLGSELRRRLPNAEILLQVDEPALVAVQSGAIPTSSGFGKHRAVDRGELAAALEPLAGGAWLHCCATGSWLEVASRAGFAAVSIDAALFRDARSLDLLTDWAHAGRGVMAGIVDAARRAPQRVDELVRAALDLLRPLELGLDALGRQVVLGTSCGLAGWQIRDLARQLAALREAAVLVEENLSAP